MSYIGREPQIGNFQVCDAISVVNNQAAYTMQVGGVNVSPETENHMLVSLNGILQAPGSSYTVSGSTITFAANLVTGDVINFIQILGSVLDLGVPSDSTVSLAKLTATGTKNSTTFLRGDNTFAEAGGGKVLQVSNFVQASATQTISSSSYTDLTDLSIAITPSASNSKIMLTTNISSYLNADEGYGMQFLKGSSSIYANRQTYAIYNGASNLYSNSIFSFIDSPSTTSEITYKVQVRTHAGAATDFNIGTFSTFYLMEIGA